MQRPLARHAVAASVALLVLLQAASAQFGDPNALPGEPDGGPATFHAIRVGTDAAFEIAALQPPADGPIDWAYQGTGEGEGGCTTGYQPGNGRSQAWNLPLCEAVLPFATMTLRIDTSSNVPPLTGHARGGFGVGYDLQARCYGQIVAGRPMWVNVTYDVEGAMRVDAGAFARVDLWANPTAGRGGSGGEGTPLAPPSNVLVESHEASFPSDGPERVDMKVLAPVAGEQATLLYGHASSGKEATATGFRQAELNATLRVHEVRFDFHDVKSPSAWTNVTDLAGAKIDPDAVGGDGTGWFHRPIVEVYDSDDDYSCPKSFTIPAESASNLPVDDAKSALTFTKTADGRYPMAGAVRDHANNERTFSRLVGVDRWAPNLSLRTIPPSPNGQNGWFVGPQGPVVVIGCVDDTSGCRDGRYRFQADGGYTSFSAFPVATHAAPQGPNFLECSVRDHAALSASCGYPVVAPYDALPPAMSATCSPTRLLSAPCDGAWVRPPAQVDLVCDDEFWGSAYPYEPCWFTNYTLDGGPLVPAERAGLVRFQAVGDGAHTVHATGTDPAGNPTGLTATFRIDGVPPGKPALTYLNGTRHLATSPAWRWSASDEGSGVADHHLVFNNGTHRNTTATTLVVTDLPDGETCLVVHARDQAGNEGPASDRSCVFVDRTDPQATIHAPLAGWIYRDGAPWLQLGSKVIALGNLTLRTSAQDPGGAAASGLVLHKTLLNGTDWTPREGSNVCHGPACDHTYAPGETGPHGWKRFTALARDLVGREGTKNVSVAFVDALAYAGATRVGATTLPYVHVEWLPYAGAAPFARYEVHRSPLAGAEPSPATWQTSVADAGQLAWRDKVVAPQTAYWYRIVAIASVEGYDVEAWRSIEFPARTPAAGASEGQLVLVEPADGFG